MKERYLIIKKLYKDYVILIKDKNNNYISFDEDEKIIHYFGIKDVNTIYLNNLEIEEKYEYENNRNVGGLMQKRIRIVSVSIILVIILIGIIVYYNNSNNKYSFTQDGIRYALTLDGKKTTSFPSKGMYQVQVSCDNANGKWLYDEWKLAIENIKGDISCDISFNTISKTNLNDYIISLAGTKQGTGQVVKETANIPDYSSAVAILESSYTSQSIFSSTSSSSTSGTAVSDVFTFADNKWTSVPSAMTSGTYYHFKFSPSESGYYQMCYDFSVGNSNNRLYAYANTKTRYFDFSSSYLSASTSASKSGCIELGYVSTSDYIKIAQRAYTDISTLSFSIKKEPIVKTAIDTRYEGKNPNNYIWFNNEYWRIIGVFDSASHGQDGKNLVKIIRADVLDSITWDKNNKNDWTASSLNSLLNGAYYNAQDGTDSGYCYGDSNAITANCDYTKRGIQTGYRGMIANVTWYLGGFYTTEATTEAFYGYERGTIVYSGRPTSTTGYIGLMYPSDYGYSVLSSSCARITNLRSYYSNRCAGQSWLSGKGIKWTLTPGSSGSGGVFFLASNGRLYYNGNAYYGYGSRPVLYLDASVYKIDGDGSLKNPYIVGM